MQQATQESEPKDGHPDGTSAEARSGPALGIWELAWPAIVGNLLHSTVGIVDIKIVGSLGSSAVAAVTTGNRIFFVLQGILIAVTAGTTALVARAWGANDHDEAERVTKASLWLTAGVAGVMTIPGVLFARQLAGVFALEPETLELAATFIRWISAFNLAFAFNLCIGSALRAAGDTRTPLWVGALTNVLNIFLVYALVYGEFGFPELGVAGAAIANGAAFSMGALVFAALWGGGKLVLGVGPKLALTRERIRRLLFIGYPAGLEQAVWQSGFIVFLWIVALYGTAPYAAYGIGVSILSFSFVVGIGFSIAASTLVGQHLGAEDTAAAEHSGWRAMRLSIYSMVGLGLAIILFAEQIARFMIDDPEVVRLTVVFIYCLGAMQPLMAIEFSLSGALRGAGDTRFPLITVATGLFGGRIALSALFVWMELSVEWIFGALIADYIIKGLMLTLRFRSGRWAHVLTLREGP
jgi:putative MATE family efflux protein